MLWVYVSVVIGFRVQGLGLLVWSLGFGGQVFDSAYAVQG